MALQTEAQWKQFFQNAKIDETTSTTYAQKFVAKGFNELSLNDLDKDGLVELHSNGS